MFEVRFINRYIFSNCMIIYNPHNEHVMGERILEAEKIFAQIPAKYCFITGSFLYKEKYEDIDVFVLTRSKKTFDIQNKMVKVTIIDFNDLYSLFYHSVSKNILPCRPLKVTLSDYWSVINEVIPTLLNQKNKFHKNVRFLVLYTQYFKTGELLDTFQLNERISSFKNYKEIMTYITQELPSIINKNAKPSYVKRFFYTQAGYYKELQEYGAQHFLYDLTKEITRGVVHG